jgi:hypothetical protein
MVPLLELFSLLYHICLKNGTLFLKKFQFYGNYLIFRMTESAYFHALSSFFTDFLRESFCKTAFYGVPTRNKAKIRILFLCRFDGFLRPEIVK